MFRGLRPPRWFVARAVHALVRSFPSERVTITRDGQPLVSGMETTFEVETVYEGEALFIPEGEVVERYGLGQVEEERPRLLISGNVDVRQGDKITRSPMPVGYYQPDTRRYVVHAAPNHWQAFTVVALQNWEQGTV